MALLNAADPVPPTPKYRILVVDDSEDSAEGLAALVRLLGHDARTAHDGQEALAVADAYRPALAFIDIGLPDMDGYQVARRMRETPGLAATVLVALTGYSGADELHRSEAAGFDRHLVKPLDFGELERLLRSLPKG